MDNVFPSSHSYIAWTSIVKRLDRPKIPSIVSSITNGDERCVRVASNPLVALETGRGFRLTGCTCGQRCGTATPHTYLLSQNAYNIVVTKAVPTTSPLTIVLGSPKVCSSIRLFYIPYLKAPGSSISTDGFCIYSRYHLFS